MKLFFSFILLFFTLCPLVSGEDSRQECDSPSHSCDTCTSSNCFWCQGPSKHLHFCTSNPNLCVDGLLFEDNLFCPKTEPSFNSLEWWGENAFISRTTACTDFSYGCEACVSQQSPLQCGFCDVVGVSSKCNILSPSVARCPQSVGCVRDRAPVSSTPEDTPKTLEVNPLFLVPGEVNGTETSTSSVMNVLITRFGSGNVCTASFDADLNVLTVTPAPNRWGTCVFTITATALTPVNGYRTRLVSKYTLNIESVQDAPTLREDTFDNTVAPLSNLKQDQSIKLEGCSMFQDADNDDFIVLVSGDTGPSGLVSVETATGTLASRVVVSSSLACTCYSGNRQCPIVVTGLLPGDGTLTFQASDATTMTSDPFSVPISVQAVNHAPSCSPTSGFTFTIDENSLSNSVQFSSPNVICTDQDTNDQLQFSISSEINSLARDVSIDGTTLTFNLDGIKNGITTSRVTVIDGNGGTTSFPFILSVTAVNDPVTIIDETWSGRTFAGLVGTTQTFDLSSVVSDEESTFSGGTLKCVPTASSSSDAAKALVTISQNKGTIQFIQPSAVPGVTWTITCSDNPLSSSGGPVVLTLIAEVDYNNHAPIVSTKFPNVTGVPPTSGTVSVSTLSLSNYFKDQDLGQTLTFSFVVSNTSALSASITSNILTVSLNAGASGNYQINVTATDDDPTPLSVIQTLTVLAYVQPKCSSISSFWNPSSSLTLDLTQYCVGSGTFTLSFTESKTNNTLLGNVTTQLTGTKITFTAVNSCIVGKYVGVATVTDDFGNFSSVSIQLTTNNTATTIGTQKSIYSFLVTPSPSSSFTGYDGNVQLNGDGSVKVNLVQVIKMCGSVGGLSFTNSGDTSSWNITTGQHSLVSSIDGVNLNIKSVPVGAINQAWSFSTNVTATDQRSGTKSTFKLNVTKLYS